jgi:hypothetical protein
VISTSPGDWHMVDDASGLVHDSCVWSGSAPATGAPAIAAETAAAPNIGAMCFSPIRTVVLISMYSQGGRSALPPPSATIRNPSLSNETRFANADQ